MPGVVNFTSADNYACTHLVRRVSVLHLVLDYWSSPCKTKWLEPCGMRHRTTSVPAFFSHRSKGRTFAANWNKAFLCSLPTERAATATLATLGRFPCSLYGTMSEAYNTLRQHIEEEWQQWRQGRDCVHWNASCRLMSWSFVRCCVVLMLCCCSESVQWMLYNFCDIVHEWLHVLCLHHYKRVWLLCGCVYLTVILSAELLVSVF